MKRVPFKVNVSVIIRKNEDFLLIKRADDEEVFPGLWGIPGGTVEATDATLEAALDRECIEEVGIYVKNANLISNNIASKSDKAVLYLVYEANYLSGVPKALDGTAEVKWLKIEDVRNLSLTPKTLEVIETCLAS